jgi:hypothetical protein
MQTTPKNMPQALAIHCIAEMHKFLGSPNAFVLHSRAHDLFLVLKRTALADLFSSTDQVDLERLKCSR